MTELLLRSKAHWGYDADFIQRCRNVFAILPEWIAKDTFFVLQKKTQIIGFYSLQQQDLTVELTDLFIEPSVLGHGYGKLLWHHAIETVRSFGVSTLLIKSDPNAAGFYEAMGAKQIGETPSVINAGRMLPLLEFKLV
ncbi:MAG: GNAT family N-acetyltransferase [Stenomitos rutilans HA7619-LM2]|nr:GNAT family N-acetyltransferase [Stenomitos rutilans HA7619-LM2]